MKSYILLFAVLVSTPVIARKPSPAPVPSPAPSPTARFTLDTPIETIAADPAGRAVLDADLPGTTTHPMYEQFKPMSLNQLQPISQGALTDATMAKVKANLAAIK